jgi:hypothetical protein
MAGFFAILEFVAGIIGGLCDTLGQWGTPPKRITIAIIVVCIVVWAMLSVAIIYLLVLARIEGRPVWWR